MNLVHYPPAVTRLLLTEPNRHMAAKMRTKAIASTRNVRVVEAAAETLPIRDATVDTVVCTLVLCSVSNPQAVLREVARVLKPRGRLLFIEHVRARSARLAKWQDRLQVPWSWYACGCQCNRDTLASINLSPLIAETIGERQLQWISPLVRPLIVGSATRL